ncbi:MAG: hypothetical protein ACM31L_04445 [Actinomycetota bacterium]
MRRLIVLAGFLLAAAPAAADGFLSAYEDLPLAPGLAEDTTAALSFDSPGGRIVDALARGAVKPAEVLKFYGATLPQLGWSRESDTVWRRESEVLRIEATHEGRGAAVRFHVSPE